MGLDQDLIQAILARDAARVKTLLVQGTNPDAARTAPSPAPWWKVLLNKIRWFRGELVLEHGYLSLLSPTPAVVLAASEVNPETVAVSMLQSLLEHGANVNARDGIGNTALHYASNSGSAGLMDLLLRGGANVDLTNHSGHTPLIVAPRSGNPEVVARLLAAGSQVDCQDDFGTSALMAACYGPSGQEMVSMLLAAGADPGLRNINGHDALAIAEESGNLRAAAPLREALSRGTCEGRGG